MAIDAHAALAPVEFADRVVVGVVHRQVNVHFARADGLVFAGAGFAPAEAEALGRLLLLGAEAARNAPEDLGVPH